MTYISTNNLDPHEKACYIARQMIYLLREYPENYPDAEFHEQKWIRQHRASYPHLPLNSPERKYIF